MTTTLAVTNEQSFWDDKQIAALKGIGLADVPKPELAVFLHFCQRTGLDPFARQIYMIGRGGRYTIQASIDGLRIVAQRSGNYGGQTPVEWCGDDGKWIDVWLAKTPPVAARVGVYYKDTPNPTYAVAKFESYNAGSPIWKKMPDLMIAKCAEALALRKAFPQDLSGIYAGEEMEQADVTTTPATSAPIKKIEVITQGESSELDYATKSKIEADLALVQVSGDIKFLRSIYNKYMIYLDYKIEGSEGSTTLREVINAQRKKVEEKASA